MSVASETAALAALGNEKYMNDVRDKLVQERQRLREALDKLPFLTPYPSSANFVLCKVRALSHNRISFLFFVSSPETSLYV